jgi:hypothetical protein
MKILQYYLACLSHASYMITDEKTKTAALQTLQNATLVLQVATPLPFRRSSPAAFNLGF